MGGAVAVKFGCHHCRTLHGEGEPQVRVAQDDCLHYAMPSSAAQAFNATLAYGRQKGYWRRAAGLGLQMRRESLVPNAYFLNEYPEAEALRVDMGQFQFTQSNMDPMEVYILMALTMLLKPKRIFEFGTFDGATTLRLARAAPEAEIVTLDLHGETETAMRAAERGEAVTVGQRFAGTSEAYRITQLRGDSLHLDISPYINAMDLVVIDGGHNYEVVKVDTTNALTMTRPGGIIVWDDFSPLWPDVVRVVEEVAAQGAVARVRHLSGTELAIALLS